MRRNYWRLLPPSTEFALTVPYSEILGSQVEEFRQEILQIKYRDRIKFLTYETFIGHLRGVAHSEANSLADFLEERIDTICRKQRT